MCTYTKLEVDQEGHLLQSGKIVPSSGVLPYPQTSTDHPRYATAYTEGFDTSLVTVALRGKPDYLNIDAIYVPPKLKLNSVLFIPPILTFIATTYALIYALFLSDYHSVYFYLFSVCILTFLIFIPHAWWVSTIYHQHAPPAHIIEKLKKRYPHIPIYRDSQIFLNQTL